MIEPVAAQVNVSKERIFANTFLWDSEGNFTSHLDSEPTSRAGGKAKVVADLKAKHGEATSVPARLLQATSMPVVLHRTFTCVHACHSPPRLQDRGHDW